jgi:para-nitrobenzyl esterase
VKRCWIGALCAVVAFSTSRICFAAEPVQTDAGLIEGIQSGDLTVYKGVPFAAPPIGNLRWRDPQPVTPWQGVRNAGIFSPVCMQDGTSVPGQPVEPHSEDCLYLNIWTPAKSAGERLPVMVWIPGGGFVGESGSLPLYGGDALAAKGVILITINYRVDVFGFFTLPELTKESAHGTSGNYGLLDQIAALKWVRRNIANFGGDPNRVTVWGQSAGSMSVNLLMASPLAHGLFQRAIGESGGFFIPPSATPFKDSWYLPGNEKIGEELEAKTDTKSLAELRARPADQILAAANPMGAHPIIDGYVVPSTPYEVFAAAKQNDVPILIGSNADEGKPFLDGLTIKAATYARDIRNSFGDLPDDVLNVYPHATDAQAREARANFERDLRFGWDVWTWARMQSKTGDSPVFYYYWAHVPPYPAGSPFAAWGAGHWSELPYTFGHLDSASAAWTPEDRKLEDAMTTYWTNFAKTGDPNGKSVPQWPAFTNADPRVQHIDGGIAAGSVANLPGLEKLDADFSAARAASENAPH